MKTKRRTWIFCIVSLGLMLTGPVFAQKPPAVEEEAKVTGIQAQRPDGRFLGLAVEGNAFVLRFYDKDKIEIAADLPRGTARWSSPQKAGQQRAILNSNGQALVSTPNVRPPLVFNAFISLMSAEGEVVESYNFNLRLLE